MTDDHARELLREYITMHYKQIQRAAPALFVSVAHLSHMLSGRKRINDRILRLIGLRRVETLERIA